MTFTDQAPEEWKGYERRIDDAMLKEVLAMYDKPPICYVCGPTPMVEAATTSLVRLGIDANTIKAERFGSTA